MFGAPAASTLFAKSMEFSSTEEPEEKEEGSQAPTKEQPNEKALEKDFVSSKIICPRESLLVEDKLSTVQVFFIDTERGAVYHCNY